jgi:glycerol-3-phosphate acyltransferase PlsY
MIGAASLLLFAILLRKGPFAADRWLTAFAALSALLTVARHHTNIRRLFAGTEGKIGRSNSKRNG